MDDEDWDAEIDTSTNYTKPAVTYQQQAPSHSSYTGGSSSANRTGGFSNSIGRGRMLNSLRNDQSSSNSNHFGGGSSSGGGNGGDDYNRQSSRHNDQNNNKYDGEEKQSAFSSFSKPAVSFSSSSNSGGGFSDTVSVESRQMSAIIGKAGATINNIKDKCSVRISTPSRDEVQGQRFADIKITGNSQADIDEAKRMIKEVTDTNQNRPEFGRDRGRERDSGFGTKSAFGSYKRVSDEKMEDNDDESPFNRRTAKRFDDNATPTEAPTIDWNMIRAQPLQNMSKFKDHPPVIKDFYNEHPEIAAMSREEVKAFRKENFDISVSFFVKETLSYVTAVVKNEEEEALKLKSPEELEDLVYEQIPKPVKTIEHAFRDYPEILEQCKKQNFLKPTPIQAQIWPILLKGLDCIGIAQTGTGKTLGFLLPALVHTDNQITPREQRVGPNVLVMSPTRELAIQIEQEVKKINYKGIKSVCVYGGGDRKEQVNTCDRGVQIIIATPGRLWDLIQAGVINVTSVTFLVLDEADRMLDMGFEPQIMKILLDIRPDRQTVMTSATWPEGVRRLAIKYLCKPVQLYVGSLDLRAAKTVRQLCQMVRDDDDKRRQLMHYIEHEMTDEDKLLVFVGRKATCDNISTDLILKNIQCQSIHGDREQCDREEALADFKNGTVRILVATDVASRGIDVKDITRVINYDFPRNIEEYVHRVGRTGRAGRTGASITFIAREDWKHAKELIEILRQGEQIVPDNLVEMAERYEAMLKKKLEEEGPGGARFGRGGGGGGGGGIRFGGGGGGGGGGDGCFKCGESGHFSRECPKSGGGGGGGGFGGGGGDCGGRSKSSGGGCFKCGESGHFSRECPKSVGGMGGGFIGGFRPPPRGRAGGRRDDDGGFSF